MYNNLKLSDGVSGIGKLRPAEDCPVKGYKVRVVSLEDHGVSTDEVVEGGVVVDKVMVGL